MSPILPFPVLALEGFSPDPAVPTPEVLLGHPLGARPASVEEIRRCAEAWAKAAPDRLAVREAGASSGGRALWVVDVNPRHSKDAFRVRAWHGAGLHGSELSGPDAALGLLYFLAADQSPRTRDLLDSLQLVVAPCLNPDGRARFRESILQHVGLHDDGDDQGLSHLAPWPRGCLNHRLCDLNRDWLFGTQEETRAWQREILALGPDVLLDAHEYGSHGTYLFSPSRAPFHPAFPEDVPALWRDFAKDHAAAFDAERWKYCTGEWLEDWYPGYTTSWSAYLGAVPIIHEQSRVSQGSITRPSGTRLDYAGSVTRQLTSALANLRTAARLRERLVDRRKAFASGPVPRGIAAWIVAGEAPDRLAALHEMLRRHQLPAILHQGVVEVVCADGSRRTVGPGAIIVKRLDNDWRLADAILDPDVRLKPEDLARERRALDRGEASTFYDVSAWNPALLAGAEVLAASSWNAVAPPIVATLQEAAGLSPAWVLPSTDDAALRSALEAARAGWTVGLSRVGGSVAGVGIPAGSFVVHREDPSAGGSAAPDGGWMALPGGLADDADGPSPGGTRFARLRSPRVGLWTRWPSRDVSVGEIWRHVEERLGLPVTLLDHARATQLDLRRYDVLVVPDLVGPALLLADAGARRKLRAWIESGGTLVALGRGAEAIAADGLVGPGELRFIGTTVAPWAEPRAGDRTMPTVGFDASTPESVLGWSDKVDASAAKPPGAHVPRALLPYGSILAARVDAESPISLGLAKELPVMVGADPVFVPGPRAEVPVRLGVPLADGAFRLRIAGHLWPEAAAALLHAPVVVREAIGHGQVILFPGQPLWRGVATATARLFSQALLVAP